MHLTSMTLLGLALVWPGLATPAKKVRESLHVLLSTPQTHIKYGGQLNAVSRHFPTALSSKSASSPHPPSAAPMPIPTSALVPARARALSQTPSNPALMARNAKLFPGSRSSKQATAPIPSSAAASATSSAHRRTRSVLMIPVIPVTLPRTAGIAVASAC